MRIQHEARTGYLYIQGTGEFDFQEAQTSVPKAFRECINHHLNKVLVDLRDLRVENNRIGRYFYLEGIGKLHDEYVKAGYPPISIVYVGSSTFVSDDNYEERVAEPYTFNIKTTADIDEGLEWLSAQQDS